MCHYEYSECSMQYKILKRKHDLSEPMGSTFCVETVRRSFGWLGHRGYTQLNAFHPEYRKDDRAWNTTHHTYPRVAYAQTVEDVVRFVTEYAASRMVCYSLNPLHTIPRNSNGYARSAVESEIPVSQNFLFDFDARAKTVTPAHADAFERFRITTNQYFQDQGFLPPVHAFTGRGYHWLCSYRPIPVTVCPDISARLKMFQETFRAAYRQELETLDVT